MKNFRSFFYPVRVVFILFTAAVMVLIFMFSCEDSEESSDRSGAVTEIVTQLVEPGFKELPPAQQEKVMDRIERIIRKAAHFTIYTALGFCASCAVGKRRLLSAATVGVLGFCFLYACSDELHQRFVSGRSGEFRDVMIDTSGSFTGLLLSFIAIWIISELVSRHRSVKDAL
ncbi:MAG TPA: VanZ family protein [Ruminococcus sp.]|nr:VanZ family protein [Ruminococcus sp.]